MKKNPYHIDDLYISFAEKYPWAFDKLALTTQINDHILYLGRKVGGAFLRYVTPGVYKLDYLEKFKDSHLTSFPLELPNGGVGPLSVWFQPNNYQLIQANLGLVEDDDTEFSASVIIHTPKPQIYIDVLKDIREFRIIPPEKNMGFLK